MSAVRVALTRCCDYREPDITGAVEKQFELPGGVDRFVRPGDRVLIKPNFIAPRSCRHAAQTHPAVVLAVAKLLKDCRARPFVGDSPAWSDIGACARSLGLIDPLARLGVPLQQLDQPRWCRVGQKQTKVGISSHVLDADVVINLPKFKTHQQLVTTFAIKNMFGCVSGKHKALWHFRKGADIEEFCELLVEIYRFVGPVLTIIDGVYAMDGAGPINGRRRPLGWLVGGEDPVACEAVCCRLVNLDPMTLPLIKAAVHLQFGCDDWENIKVVGDDYSAFVCDDFELPEMVPLRFSLGQVCRSIVRQIALLAGYKRTKKQTIESDDDIENTQ